MAGGEAAAGGAGLLTMAVVLMVMTPVTIDAGQWLFAQEKDPTAVLRTHAERGEQMIYFAGALLVVAVVLAVVHWWEGRSDEPGSDKRWVIAHIAVALLAVVVGVSSIVAVVRTGDAGSRSVWGDKTPGGG